MSDAWRHELRGRHAEWVTGGPHVPEGMDTPNMRLAERAGLLAADTRLSPPDRLLETTDPDEARETGAMLDIDHPIDAADLDRPDVGRGVGKQKRKIRGPHADHATNAIDAVSRGVDQHEGSTDMPDRWDEKDDREDPDVEKTQAGLSWGRTRREPGEHLSGWQKKLDAHAAGAGARQVTDTAALTAQAEGPAAWREQMAEQDEDMGEAAKAAQVPADDEFAVWEAIRSMYQPQLSLMANVSRHGGNVTSMAEFAAQMTEKAGRHPVTGRFVSSAPTGAAAGHPYVRDAGPQLERGDPGLGDVHLVNSDASMQHDSVTLNLTSEGAVRGSSYACHHPVSVTVEHWDAAADASATLFGQLGMRRPAGALGMPAAGQPTHSTAPPVTPPAAKAAGAAPYAWLTSNPPGA